MAIERPSVAHRRSLRALGGAPALTHHPQDVGRHHLHAAHGGSQGAHDGGDDIESTDAEQQLLQDRRMGRQGEGGGGGREDSEREGTEKEGERVKA